MRAGRCCAERGCIATRIRKRCLDLETLDLVLEGPDLLHEVGGLVGGDRASNDGARDTAGTAERHLARDVDVGDVLVLAKEGQVQQDGERARVRSEDDQLGDTAVEGLGGLVGTLLDLTCKSTSQYNSTQK